MQSNRNDQTLNLPRCGFKGTAGSVVPIIVLSHPSDLKLCWLRGIAAVPATSVSTKAVKSAFRPRLSVSIADDPAVGFNRRKMEDEYRLRARARRWAICSVPAHGSGCIASGAGAKRQWPSLRRSYCGGRMRRATCYVNALDAQPAATRVA
jgi:hypothetical protein